MRGAHRRGRDDAPVSEMLTGASSPATVAAQMALKASNGCVQDRQ
jgi:hypothetical protein